METMSTPERPALGDWRSRVPAKALREAERLGPLSRDNRETDEDRAERLAQQAANRATRWRSRLPLLYQDAVLSDLLNDPEQHDVGARCADWLAAMRGTLVLAGPVGTGKTHAAYAVGNVAVARGVWAEAWTLADLLADLRPEGDRRADYLARTCDLLVLDDLGATRVSDFAVDVITSIVDVRVNEGRALVVTTNLPGAQAIRDAWGNRLTDRLMFRATVCSLVGESRRRDAW